MRHGAARRVGRVAAAFILALAATACGGERTYTADPIAARIVDADTGAPVEGVNVVAAWQAKGGLEGGNIMGYVKVMEDVTNANGEFSFPGWGPKKWSNGGIRDGAPLLILLKPGYEVSFVWEHKYGVEFAPSHMSSSWHKKTISLRRFATKEAEVAQLHTRVRTILDTLIPQRDCAWHAIPRFISAVDQQDRALLAAGSKFGLESLEALEGRSNKNCGSVKAYVLEHRR
jgi:hypothetical protein